MNSDIPKGRAKAEINQAAYKHYVEQLKAEEKGFPRNKDGDANLSEIARKCGFGRDRLYESSKSKLYEQFAKDLVTIGVEGTPPKTSHDEYLAKKVEQKSRDASALKADLDAKVQEVASLRDKVEELTTELNKLKRQKSENEAAMDELESTGRRCFFR